MTAKRPDRTLGPGHDEFWDFTARGELRLQRCARCGHIAWPAGQVCEACQADELVWTRMSGDATLASWCRFERDYYGGLLPMPWDTILVELAEGALMISNPQGFSTAEGRVGMPLKLAFIACEDTAGAFSLPVFMAAEATRMDLPAIA